MCAVFSHSSRVLAHPEWCWTNINSTCIPAKCMLLVLSDECFMSTCIMSLYLHSVFFCCVSPHSFRELKTI